MPWPGTGAECSASLFFERHSGWKVTVEAVCRPSNRCLGVQSGVCACLRATEARLEARPDLLLSLSPYMFVVCGASPNVPP